MIISEKTGGKVDIREDGKVWVDDCPYGYWRKQGDMYVNYMPGILSTQHVKIVQNLDEK